MKITVNKKDLVHALKRISAVIPGRTTLEILHYAKIETDKLGIKVRATDLDQWVTVHLPGKIEKAGKGLFPVKNLEKAIKAFSGEEISITFTGDGKVETCRVELICGKTKFKTDSRPLDEFPSLPETLVEFGFGISSEIMVRILEKSLYAVSTDLTRPALCGVLLRLKKGKLTVVSTDGTRLCALKTSSVTLHEVKGSKDSIIQSKSLKILKDYANKKGSLWAHTGGEWIQFSIYNEEGKGEMQILSRILEGPFPNYEKVIPQELKVNCTLSREELLDSVKRISVFSDQLTHSVRLKIEKTKLTLSTENTELGTASEDLECKANNTLEVGYNAQYLLQALSTLENEEVTLKMENAEHAGLIEEKTEDLEHLVIVMPLRI